MCVLRRVRENVVKSGHVVGLGSSLVLNRSANPIVPPHVVDSRSTSVAISQPQESRHGCDDYPANRQNYPGGCLYEPLLAARKHPRSGKSIFHLDVLPTSRPLTAHLAAGLQRSEVGVSKR